MICNDKDAKEDPIRYQLLHTCIRVFDLKKSIAFYERALGMRVARTKDYPDDRFTLVYLKDTITSHELELTYNYDQEEPYDLGTGYSHIAVQTDDFEASRQAHQNAGYQITEIYGLPGSSSRFYFLMDPDGYRIEVKGK